MSTPPVHAWASIFMFNAEQARTGKGDVGFLKHAFQKLLLNFTWWVNRKDPTGKNVFQGGFLGLDNIGVFDRSAPLPTGGQLEQADGTAWMALFSINMLEIAAELAMHDPIYEEMALKFLEHFLWIASSMDRIGERHDEMWDEEDGFFYDVMRLPDGRSERLKVRSMVGLLPFCATTIFFSEVLEKVQELRKRANWFLKNQLDLLSNIHDPRKPGYADRRMLAILDERKLRQVLSKLLDEKEFLSPYGIRSLSRYHAEHPFIFHVGGHEYRVNYLPAESDSGMFGGNSNWRGPIWMPVNALIVRALLNYTGTTAMISRWNAPRGQGNRWPSTRLPRISPSVWGISSCAMSKGGGQFMEVHGNSRTTHTGGIVFYFTNIFTVITAPV